MYFAWKRRILYRDICFGNNDYLNTRTNIILPSYYYLNIRQGHKDIKIICHDWTPVFYKETIITTFYEQYSNRKIKIYLNANS